MTVTEAYPQRAPEHQLWTAKEFRRRQRSRAGVIVIYDRVRPDPVAHVPDCFHVTIDRFHEKIVEMGGKNGRYWWFAKYADAAEALDARRCRHCDPKIRAARRRAKLERDGREGREAR